MNSLANLLKPFLLGFVLNFLKSKGPNQTFSFRIFRVLHTVQSLIFKVLRCSLSQTAHICYHKLFCLSRTFSKTFSFRCCDRSAATFVCYHIFPDLSTTFLFFSSRLRASQRRKEYNTRPCFKCQQVFFVFLIFPICRNHSGRHSPE